MKKFTYILLLLAGMASTSCLKVFDPEFDETPVIYLESFPGVDEDKVTFVIKPAYSRSNTPQIIQFDPEIVFEVNGAVVPVECVEPKECYYVAYYAPKPGDKMSISVRSEGFTSISSQTVVPEAFPERKIDYRQVQSGLDEYVNVLFVTFSGARSDYGYGMYIWNETVYEKEDGPETWVYTYPGWIYPDPSNSDYSEIMPSSIASTEFYFNGTGLRAWEGELLDSESCTCAVEPRTNKWGEMSSYDSFFEHTGKEGGYDDDGNMIGPYPYVERNKIALLTMTEEFYKYNVAQELQGDFSGLIGFIAPTNYCYSNIDNGYGAFAGVSVVYTDWITKEFIENNR